MDYLQYYFTKENMDLVFWCVGALVCIMGAIAATFSVVWWFICIVMDKTGLSMKLISALKKVYLAEHPE